MFNFEVTWTTKKGAKNKSAKTKSRYESFNNCQELLICNKNIEHWSKAYKYNNKKCPLRIKSIINYAKQQGLLKEYESFYSMVNFLRYLMLPIYPLMLYLLCFTNSIFHFRFVFFFFYLILFLFIYILYSFFPMNIIASNDK